MGQTAWLSRDLLVELRWKREVQGHWKQGQMWEGYRGAVYRCEEKICAGKAELQLELDSRVRDKKRSCFKYVNSKRSEKMLVCYLMSNLTNRDVDKTELMPSFLLSLTLMTDPGTPRAPSERQ